MLDCISDCFQRGSGECEKTLNNPLSPHASMHTSPLAHTASGYELKSLPPPCGAVWDLQYSADAKRRENCYNIRTL